MVEISRIALAARTVEGRRSQVTERVENAGDRTPQVRVRSLGQMLEERRRTGGFGRGTGRALAGAVEGSTAATASSSTTSTTRRAHACAAEGLDGGLHCVQFVSGPAHEQDPGEIIVEHQRIGRGKAGP